MWRPPIAKKPFQLTLTDGLETGYDLNKRCKRARSPDPAPTQVWRPEMSKRFHPARQKARTSLRLSCFVKSSRKHNMRSFSRLSMGPDRSIARRPGGRKHVGRTHVAFGELESHANRIFKRVSSVTRRTVRSGTSGTWIALPPRSGAETRVRV